MGGGGKGAPAAGLGRKPGLHPRGEGLKALKEMSEVKKKSKGILRGLVTEKCKRFLSCWEVLPEKKAKQTHSKKKATNVSPSHLPSDCSPFQHPLSADNGHKFKH